LVQAECSSGLSGKELGKLQENDNVFQVKAAKCSYTGPAGHHCSSGRLTLLLRCTLYPDQLKYQNKSWYRGLNTHTYAHSSDLAVMRTSLLYML